MAASNPRRVGQGSKGLESSLVSMKWSWGYRGQQERSPDCRSSGQSLVHSPVQVERQVSRSCEWVQGGAIAPWSMGAGRAKSPCEWSTGDTVGWLWKGSIPWKIQGRGDATGGAQRPPLPRWFCITKHILRVSCTVPCARRSAKVGEIRRTEGRQCVSMCLPKRKSGRRMLRYIKKCAISTCADGVLGRR